MPAVVAFLIALFVAFYAEQTTVSLQNKIEVIAKGVGEENIITMSLIFPLRGRIFRSGNRSRRSGQYGESGTLSDTDRILRWQDCFIIGCFISVSMGTSMGTITALAPIAVGISETDRVCYWLSVLLLSCAEQCSGIIYP